MPGRKKKIWIITGSVLSLIIVLIISFNSIVAGIIKNKIDDFLHLEKLKNYHITYSRVGFNFMNRSVSLIGLHYQPDSLYLDSLAKANVDMMVPELSLGRLTVAGIQFKTLLKEKKLIIRKITVKNPVIKMYKFNGIKKPVTPAKKQKVSFKDSVRLVLLHGVFIRTIRFKKSKWEIYNYKRHKYTLVSNNISLEISDLMLKNSGHQNQYFYPSLKEAFLTAKDNYIQLGNQLYDIQFDKLFVDLKGNELYIDGFRYKPLYSKKDFSKHIRFQKERFDMRADKISFDGANFYLYLTKGKVYIRKIGISHALIDLYRDKKVPFNHKQRPLFPQQSLKKIPGKITIDTIQILNSRFQYSESSPVISTPLIVYFSDLSGTITHVTNVPSLWQKSNMKINLTGRMMNKAPFYLRFSFPLASVKDTFYFSGAVRGPVAFRVFNPAIYPASGLKFKSGILDKMTFKGSGSPRYGTGTMTMLYHDMELVATKKKDRKASNKFMSWGVNTMVRKNNPRKGDQKGAKTASMFFQRDIEKGFGNFLWKTLYSGMKATMLPSINTINRKSAESLSYPKQTK